MHESRIGRALPSVDEGCDAVQFHGSGATLFTIVPLTPDLITAVATLHQAAFSGYMSTRIGQTYIHQFIEWFVRDRDSITLVAMDREREILGYLLAAPAGCSKAINRDLMWVAGRGILAHPSILLSRNFRATVLHRLQIVLGLSSNVIDRPVLPEPTMSLVGIGVSQQFRGNKIGLHLIKAFEQNATDLGARSLQLSVYPDNIVARHLYERCGWQPFGEHAFRHQAMYYFRILAS